MIRLSIFLICFFPFTLRAQYVVEADSVTGKRFSIGTYLTTPVSVFTGGLPYSPRLGLSARYRTRPHRSWRFQAIADLIDTADDTDEMLETISLITDSTIVYDWKNDKERRYTVRAGLEWSDNREAITPVYGIDFIAGVNVLRDQRGLVTWERDSTVNNARPLSGGDNRLDYWRNETHTQYLIGFALTAGYRFRIHDTWDIMLHISPEVYYSPFEKVVVHDLPGYDVDTKVSDLWVQLRLLEVQICLRLGGEKD
jgi:hypothetical protein